MKRIEVLMKTLKNVRHITPQHETRLTIFTDPSIADEPLPIRKAKALALLLRGVPIHIYPKELIVGMPFREEAALDESGAVLRLVPPEGISGESYIVEAQRKIDAGLGSEPYDPVIFASQPSPGGSKYALFPRYATEEERTEAQRFGLNENVNMGHLQAGHGRVLSLGWSGLRRIAADALGSSPELPEEKVAFLTSVIIALDGAIAFALRYADLAEEMARRETDPRRTEELRSISGVCRAISERPPQTFWEALQLHWLTHLICHTQGACQIGRFDQYMYPFLERDLSDGRLTKEKAQELLECLWVKYNTLTDVTMDNLQNMILGGQTRDGRDATNPLSFMCMDATERLGLVDPKWSIRIHGGTPDCFLRRACEVIRSGRYEPGVFNDEAIIPSLVTIGIPLDDARDYCNDGCSEILVQGKSNPWAFEARVNLLKCLERVVERIEGFESFEELMKALRNEISYAVEMAVANTNLQQFATPKISPNPFVSTTVEGCLEKMKDLTEGGATYNFSAVCASGVANTADALAAVKKLVYEEKKIGKSELLDALRQNFEGNERLRLMLLNRAPKFGNDDDLVDELAAEIVEFTATEVRKHRNPRGGEYILGLFSYGEYIGHGLVTGATPDGRRAGEGISPNFSPAPGRDVKGPFAAFKSTAKVSPLLTANGTALDVTLHPSALRGPHGVEKLMGLVKGFRDLGGMEVQFNIVDSEVLRAAQRDPERYRNLTVRIWGFPAYFVRLPREFQDHIISRTEHKT